MSVKDERTQTALRNDVWCTIVIEIDHLDGRADTGPVVDQLRNERGASWSARFLLMRAALPYSSLRNLSVFNKTFRLYTLSNQ
jgi:hypothetical protein